MKHGPLAARIWVAAVCGISPICLAATMEFESVPVGTKYGGAPLLNFPGQVVLTENGIKMSVEQFFVFGGTQFFQAEVTGPANDHELALNNISVLFDVTALPFNVNSLTLQYSESGGEDNFAVNGGSILQLPNLTNIPVNVAPGVTALVGGGRITLTGDIDRVLIGGQELSVDTVVAVPEPTSLLLLGVGGVAALRRLRRANSVSRSSPR